MISKAKSKFIKSLQLKKYRTQEQCFLVEGDKNVRELLASPLKVRYLVATGSWLQQNDYLLAGVKAEILEANELDLKELGTFQSNQAVLAVAEMPAESETFDTRGQYTLALADVRDPGNLGTILRIADWYGFTQVFASETTTDVYNPKVVNASMGSIGRVQVRYGNLENFLVQATVPIYGAVMDGENLHTMSFGKEGILVVGNESHGMAADILPLIQKKVTIPSFGGAESLNVAIATAVICDAIRRG
jgi:RNA methyltransferase, TrmH family